MAAISSPGLGSGLDVSGIVSALMAVERAPLGTLQTEASKITTKVSVWGKVQSQLASLQDATRGLLNGSAFTAAKASSADETKVKVSNTDGATAANYEINITNLAQKQSLTSTALSASTAVVGDGSMTFTFGSVSGGAFTADSARTPVAVTIPTGSTLSQVRDAINGAGAGVNASIITDVSGARLSIRGNDTGAAQAFQISVADGDGNNTDSSGLSKFAYALAAPGTMTASQTAANANLTIDGVAISSASNTVTGAVDSVTFQLVAPTTSGVAISVLSDSATMSDTVKTFVDAYNTLNKTLGDNLKYDAVTKRGGLLQGDRGATQLQSQLREMMRSVGTSGTPNRLTDIGLEMQRDGSITIKSSKLNAALAIPTDVANLFQHSDVVTPANGGFARRLDSKMTEWLGTNGTVNGANSTLSKRLKINQDRQDALGRRLTNTQKQLLRTYTALDAQLANLKSIPIPSSTTA